MYVLYQGCTDTFFGACAINSEGVYIDPFRYVRDRSRVYYFPSREGTTSRLFASDSDSIIWTLLRLSLRCRGLKKRARVTAKCAVRCFRLLRIGRGIIKISTRTILTSLRVSRDPLIRGATKLGGFRHHSVSLRHRLRCYHLHRRTCRIFRRS